MFLKQIEILLSSDPVFAVYEVYNTAYYRIRTIVIL